MSLWLVRAGRDGEHEERFLETHRIHLTWGPVVAQASLADTKDFEGIKTRLAELFPAETTKRLSHTAGQFWPFVFGMKPGDVVVTPLKRRSAVAVGEVIGGYRFNAAAPENYRHEREVRWMASDIPRTRFDQDLLHSFGAFMSICEVRRNDAEKRVRAMLAGTSVKLSPLVDAAPPEEAAERDLQREAMDQLARLLAQRFAGHKLSQLVEAILAAQGYITHLSPPGPDGGVDILAGAAPLGFGSLRLCVQVKSGDSPVDRPTLDQLIGTMQNFSASQGLLVSWGGFKPSVLKVEAQQFFKVRLWDADTLIGQLLAHYDALPAALKAELNLQRIWVPAAEMLA